ncbi:Nmad5 family putative nucleotide modification protein [Enterobacter asburiae]
MSTVKKLAEMWPEAVPYLPEVERREATSTALAIPVETLNALCGIPKNE